ncbi:MAG: AraC family transcriptional regulator [Tannerella sp.]|jgi:AraC-like DNA-binding protein|nr:AraC family transcriptional regulator [Tannerella sp.]
MKDRTAAADREARRDGFSGERALVLPPAVVREMEKDAYASALHITDIGYYPNARRHLRRRESAIDQHVLIHCVEGRGWFALGRGETHPVRAGQCFILPAGVPHAYGADTASPWTIYWVHFRGKLAESFSAGQRYPVDIFPGSTSRIGDRIALFEEIFHILEMGYSRENRQYACTLFHHYLGSLRYMRSYRAAAAGTKERESDAVASAIHYMKENMEKQLSLDDMVKHSGYSQSRFTSLFGRRTGYTPLAYFNQLKIQQACHLLDFTDMKISQVCHKIGIGDMYYFSRLFHKIMGMSPRAYKQMKKG